MIRETAEGVMIAVKAVPGASRDQIVGMLGDAVKIKVSAPPEGGKANDAICRLLAKTLGVAVRDVHVTSGNTQPRKRISVRGVDVATARQCLEL